MKSVLDDFREVWLVDFEFCQRDGERPNVLCMAAQEFHSGRVVRLWADQLARRASPPFSTGPDSLFVAYYASAEVGCFLALEWSAPERILDLFTEFRCLTNGIGGPCGNGLLGALAHHGLASIEATEKEEMRQLAMRGGEYTDTEKVALLDYCESDVVALGKLLPAMLPKIDLPRALFRGRYMAAVAAMEKYGVPIDVETLNRLRSGWGTIKDTLVQRIDADYGVYEGTTFKQDKLAAWLVANGIPWPRTEAGRLSLSDDTFRQMVKGYPIVSPLRELRNTLGGLRLESLAVGGDGRNRCLLSPFRSKTGRNQPSNSKFIFGPSCWMRGLIKPEEDSAVAYIDWSQQEFGIAAALSRDTEMQHAYSSGDPYLTFAKQAGAVPKDATKQTHAAEREQFKVCSLAVQYGMGASSLGQSLAVPTARGNELLNLHKSTYPAYWRWSDSAVSHAMLHGWLQTVFGWTVHVSGVSNPRSLANFPMQANGAEMLRLACCLAIERGIRVCCPVHDALLVEGPASEIASVISATKSAMCEASRVILDGFELRSDVDVINYPDRYTDKRGEKMWETAMQLITEVRPTPTPVADLDDPSHSPTLAV
jgi:hypothetical protein